jgi:hypothetical protein
MDDDLLFRATLFWEWNKNKFKGKTFLAVGYGIIDKVRQTIHYGKLIYEKSKMLNGEYSFN